MMFFNTCHIGRGGILFSIPTHVFGSLGHHHLDELLVVDLAIPVDVCLADHLIHLLICELLPEIGHHVAELGRTDEAVAIAIKDLECFDQLILRAIKDKNSGKSIVPFPSASTSLIMSCNSASV